MTLRTLFLTETQFRAMSSDAHIVVVDGTDDDLRWAAAEVERAEARWSRFRDTSEVAAVNRAAGQPVVVSRPTLALVRAAEAARIETAGAFDASLGGSLAAAGYDRTFLELERLGCGARCLPSPPAGGITIDEQAGTILVSAGRQLDLGGIAKGWTADRVATGLVARGAAGACVNLGGDVAVLGDPPDPSAWIVDVHHSTSRRPLPSLVLTSGGIATSTRVRRSWLGPDGDRRHHLLDPASARPVDGPCAEVTVMAPTAAEAEVMTKLAFVDLGRFRSRVAADSFSALVTDGDGRTRWVTP